MDDKDTIDNPPNPDAPDAYTPKASVQDTGSTAHNSPYSFRNRKFDPYSTNTTKTQKKKMGELMIKLQSAPPLPQNYLTRIPPMLSPKIMDLLTDISHIH